MGRGSTMGRLAMALCGAGWILVAGAVPVWSGGAAAVAMYWPENPFSESVEAQLALEQFATYLTKKGVLSKVIQTSYFKKPDDYVGFVSSHEDVVSILAPLGYQAYAEMLKVSPLAVAVVSGRTSTPWAVVVASDDPAQTLLELKGKSIATSYTGELAVRFISNWLFSGEIEATRFFSEIKVADSANSSVLAVVYKSADASLVPVNNPVLEQHIGGDKVRILNETRAVLHPIAVVRGTSIDQGALAQALRGMSSDPAGAAALEALKTDAWQTRAINSLLDKLGTAVASSTEDINKRPLEVLLDVPSVEKAPSYEPYEAPWTIVPMTEVFGLPRSPQSGGPDS